MGLFKKAQETQDLAEYCEEQVRRSRATGNVGNREFHEKILRDGEMNGKKINSIEMRCLRRRE